MSAEGDSLKGFTWTFRIPTKQKPLHFSEPSEYGGGGFGMKCIDMNNDGHPDIVTSSGVILISWIDLAVSGYGIPFEPFDPQLYAVLANNNSYFSNFYTFFDTIGTYEAIMKENASADLNGNGFLDLVHSGAGVYITYALDITPSVKEEPVLTSEFILYQNYPNPFNNQTEIGFKINKAEIIKEKGLVLFKVYDVLGNEVAELVNEVKDEGSYAITFNATDLPSGVYVYSIRINEFASNQKMLLLK